MRQAFLKTNSRKTAVSRMPWASKIIKVEGGYHGFESWTDYGIWVRNSGLPISSFTDWNKKYVAYKIRKALRRGLKNIDSKVEKWTIQKGGDLWN